MFNISRRTKSLGRLAVTASVLGAVTLGGVSTAFANGVVTWTNAKTGSCLKSDDSDGSYDVYTGVCGSSVSGTYLDSYWYDQQQSNSAWLERAGGSSGPCLDAGRQWSGYGTVWVDGCAGDNGNLNQDWLEINTGSGWLLHNWMSGYVLDGGNGPGANGLFRSQNVFVNTQYSGDSWQLWH
ncbi:hypothetical protein GXW82_43295 [Streptacidiphilus sp. 4-A2]|nr:hypothetical protein [Streptacidiphilus sp. 4-A2]